MNILITALLFLQDDVTVTKVDHLVIVKGPAARYKVKIRDKDAPEKATAPGIVVVDAGDATSVTVNDKQVPVKPPKEVPAIPGVAIEGRSISNNGATAVVVIELGIPRILQPGQTLTVEGPCRIIDPSTGSGMHAAVPEPVPQDWHGFPAGLSLNTRPPQFAGIIPDFKGLLGRDLEMHVQPWVRVIGAFTIIDTIEVKDFDCYGFGFTIDLTLVQISVEGGLGDFQAEGVQIHIDNGTGFITDVFDQTYDGTMWWIKVGVYWPAVIYTSGSFQASLGPDFNYLYIEEDFDTRSGPGLTFDFHRRYYERVYTVGGRLSVAISGFTFQAAGSHSFGDLTGGAMFELLAGYEIRM